MVKLTSRIVSELVPMWRNGITAKQLAEAAGVSDDTMWSYIRHHRDQFPPRRHHEDWWREMLARCDDMTDAETAAALGCSYENVRRWRRKLHDIG